MPIIVTGAHINFGPDGNVESPVLHIMIDTPPVGGQIAGVKTFSVWQWNEEGRESINPRVATVQTAYVDMGACWALPDLDRGVSAREVKPRSICERLREKRHSGVEKGRL